MTEGARLQVEYFQGPGTNQTPIRILPGGGSSGGGNGFGERVANLEAAMSYMNDTLKGVQVDVREIRSDVKNLPYKMMGIVTAGFAVFGAIVTVVVKFISL